MSFGGKFDYAKEYAKYKPESTRFGSYVDEHPDLSAAWKKIEDDPNHPDSQYWINRGATSKDAFGRAHAAEDMALKTGTYSGGRSGRTDYMPGTDAWETLFPGDDPSTRFEGWRAGEGGAGGNGAGNGASGWTGATGGGVQGSGNYPIGLVDYQEPSAMSGIPLEYQPWLQPDHIPDSLWNYQAPTLNEWEVDRNWDWATKPASEYVTEEQKAAKAAAAAVRDGGRDTDGGWVDEYGYDRVTPGTGYGPDRSYGFNPGRSDVQVTADDWADSGLIGPTAAEIAAHAESQGQPAPTAGDETFGLGYGP